MSNLEPSNTNPLVVPAESDEQFLRHLEYEDPFRKASVWLHKLIIHRIRDIQRLAPWYRGETAAPQHNEAERKLTRYGQLISDLFDQKDGRFCDRFDYYCRMLKKYRQGAVPKQIIADDLRAATILIETLLGLSTNNETIQLLGRRVNEFCRHVTRSDGIKLPTADYLAKIDTLADSIITISGRVSDEFRRIEAVRRGERSEPATKADVRAVHKTAEKTERKVDIVLVKQEETRKTVNRLDARDKKAKKNARRRFSVETQELVFGYWERGQQNPTLKREAGKRRVSYEQVFSYYKSELVALGIVSVKDFISCLGARSDRIQRDT